MGSGTKDRGRVFKLQSSSKVKEYIPSHLPLFILGIKQYTSLSEDLFQNLSTRKYAYKRKKGIKFMLDLTEIHELHVMIQTFLCPFSSSLLSKFAFTETSLTAIPPRFLCTGGFYVKVEECQFSTETHYSVRFW